VEALVVHVDQQNMAISTKASHKMIGNAGYIHLGGPIFECIEVFFGNIVIRCCSHDLQILLAAPFFAKAS
jgi:hypothetical protein